MATKKVKWFQKDGSLLHPETEVSQIVGFPNMEDYVTLNTEQSIGGAKHLTTLFVERANNYQENAQYGYNRICLNDGASLYDLSFPYENGTFALKSDIKTYTASTGISISSSNAISTTAASSTASGHVNTTTQTFAGRKTFNGGINIPSGATIQLNGSSGAAGYVMTSNGTSTAPSWKNGNTVISLLSTKTTFTTGAVYLASNWWDTYDELRVMIQEPDGPWAERSVLASWAKSYTTASGATTSVVFNISDADTARWFWAYFTSSSMYISSGVEIGGIRVYGVKYGIHS